VGEFHEVFDALDGGAHEDGADSERGFVNTAPLFCALKGFEIGDEFVEVGAAADFFEDGLVGAVDGDLHEVDAGRDDGVDVVIVEESSVGDEVGEGDVVSADVRECAEEGLGEERLGGAGERDVRGEGKDLAGDFLEERPGHGAAFDGGDGDGAVEAHAAGEVAGPVSVHVEAKMSRGSCPAGESAFD